MTLSTMLKRMLRHAYTQSKNWEIYDTVEDHLMLRLHKDVLMDSGVFRILFMPDEVMYEIQFMYYCYNNKMFWGYFNNRPNFIRKLQLSESKFTKAVDNSKSRFFINECNVFNLTQTFLFNHIDIL